MGITLLASALGLPTTFPFSLVGAADGICFISGMPSVDADGSFASGTFEEETERAWRNVVSIADAAGYSVEEILYVQCLFGDIGDYSALNDWWRPSFPTSRRRRRASPFRRGPSRSGRRSSSRRSPGGEPGA
ncbi:MAG TPA: RidA family protein [Acidimicrobiales bacterium]|nr:RidA family protein [Acidimicrobiales bacterium]